MEIAVVLVGTIVVATIIKLSLSEKRSKKSHHGNDCFSIKNVKYTIMDREN